VVFAFSDTVQTDPFGRVHTFCHAVPGKWHVMGCMLSAGGSFQWFRDNLGDVECDQARRLGVDPYEILCEEAEDAAPGSEGLIFLPYLTGERTPHCNPNAKAACRAERWNCPDWAAVQSATRRRVFFRNRAMPQRTAAARKTATRVRS